MVDKVPHDKTHSPLNSLDEWEDDLKRRYPEPDPGLTTDTVSSGDTVPAGVMQAKGAKKKASEFRNHEASARPSVREFYRLNHATRRLISSVRSMLSICR